MIFLLRYFLAVSLVHLLEGVTFGDWVRLLRRERFRISPRRWPRALWITGMSLGNSVLARRVERRFGAAVRAAKVDAPVFILGHYRSGTTYLHELLSLDDRFASPSRFQTFNPHTFLSTDRWLKPLVEPFMLPRRVQEDEVAHLVLTQLSPYLDWCFPRSPTGYGRYLTFRDAAPEEAAAWCAGVKSFLQALTLQTGKPLVLKSPTHTARVRLLLQTFPDARFVHIHRDPYKVFISTIGLLKAIQPVFRLQGGPRAVDVDEVLRVYTEMYEAYFYDRALIPTGQLVEIAYEDLARDPVGQVRSIYESLSLGAFEPFRPALDAYLVTQAGYRKTRHPQLDAALKARIAAAWSRTFDAWGYPR